MAVFDIESTGTSPRADRIIDLAIVKFTPQGGRELRAYRINPGMPIPPESTRIHGIGDADVANAPTFAAVAADIRGFLEGCDLAGYNILRFDIPMLAEEFQRVGTPLDLNNRRIVDAQRIYHRREPRDLTAALAFYCGELHLDAHGAAADVDATIRVLEGQFQRYADLPHDVPALHEYCDPKKPEWVDRAGRLAWRNGEAVVNFGKNKGAPLRRLATDDPNFLKWMVRGDFPLDTRQIVTDAIAGIFPKPPVLPAPPAATKDEE